MAFIVLYSLLLPAQIPDHHSQDASEEQECQDHQQYQPPPTNHLHHTLASTLLPGR